MTGSTNHDFKREDTGVENQSKSTKNKKRSQPGTSAEEKAPKIHSEVTTTKTKKGTQSKAKTSAKHTEVIDYSKRARASDSQSNAIGKVHQWLLESPVVAQPPSKEVEHSSKAKQMMSKSQSTPERMAQRTPKKVNSANNLHDKVKLQVVYKPPFKFSLKLSKNAAVKTKIIGSGELNKSKRKISKDKKEAGVGKSRRRALLIRSKTTDDHDRLSFNLKSSNKNNEDQEQLVPSEPNYETLETKKEPHTYENLKSTNVTDESNATGVSEIAKNGSRTEPINTDTFRINKSLSGSNIIAQNTKKLAKSSSTNNGDKTNITRNSTLNLNQPSTSSSFNNKDTDAKSYKNGSSRGSTTNLTKKFGSSQNLFRSSTTNLSKTNSSRNSFDIKRGPYDISRSSTSNLSKERRHGSQLNLLKNQHSRGSSNLENFDDTIFSAAMQEPLNGQSNHMRTRRNSSVVRVSDSNKTGIPRVPSNSNLKIPSLRRNSVNNIPRASLNTNLTKPQINSNPASQLFMRQTSLQPHSSRIHPTTSRDHYPARPHTSECNSEQKFEWPTSKASEVFGKDETVPCNLEVENLVNENN